MDSTPRDRKFYKIENGQFVFYYYPDTRSGVARRQGESTHFEVKDKKHVYTILKELYAM